MIFKILLIVILLIAFVPPVRRFLFYLLVGRQLVKEQRRQAPQPRREGETRVDYVPPRPNTNKGGDYVDYEEIK
ncbi:MAG: DUF4834 domain-containing protein [Cytophagales bacterium]|nr:MAG: DUF4834 domain-containing protein [Cytophagales bacterium]